MQCAGVGRCPLILGASCWLSSARGVGGAACGSA